MAAMLVAIAVSGILLSMAMPAWKQLAQREKEAELIFRGEQYARAIGLFQRKYAGAFPPSVDLLVEQKFLRRKYKDPMTKNGDFEILYQNSAAALPGQASESARMPGQRATQPTPQQPQQQGQLQSAFGFTGQTAGPRGGMLGVASKSKEKALRLYKGRTRYNEWQFVYSAATNNPGAPGGPPGLPRPGQGGTNPGGGFPTPGGTGPGGGFGPKTGQPGTSPFGQPGTSPFGRPGSSPFGPSTAPRPGTARPPQ